MPNRGPPSRGRRPIGRNRFPLREQEACPQGSEGGFKALFFRHRNLVILASVLFLQLSLLAYQFRRAADIPLIRHGTMYLVTPVQKGLRASTRSEERRVGKECRL